MTQDCCGRCAANADAALSYLKERAAEHEKVNDEAMQEYAAGIRDALAKLEPLLAAPAGYVLVPREPTPEMVSAYMAQTTAPAAPPADVYRAMLAAAPAAPAAPVNERLQVPRAVYDALIRWHRPNGDSMGACAELVRAIDAMLAAAPAAPAAPVNARLLEALRESEQILARMDTIRHVEDGPNALDRVRAAIAAAEAQQVAPLTEEQMAGQFDITPIFTFAAAFRAGVRFAERHHLGIGAAGEKGGDHA